MRVCVLGAGAWGTSLALLLAKKGIEVTLWCNTAELYEEIKRNAENTVYLPGYKLPNKVALALDPLTVLENVYIIVVAIPGKYLGAAAREFAGHLDNQMTVVSVVKGIEPNESLTMSELLQKHWSLDESRISVLSGPNFAKEVASRMPSAAVVASKNCDLTQSVQQLFSTAYFRVYRSSDVKGVEMGGVLKNVVAIGAGIIEGLGYGDNTKAALIVRGLEESKRLFAKMGCSEKTLVGLSCLGDMVATCSSPLSRNKRFGYLIGKGENPLEARNTISPDGQAIEGLESLEGLLKLAKALGVELPIAEEISEVTSGSTIPLKAVRRLMTRELKAEYL
jgi:glycerol-3-phosphate dehydrogenase (NAD(P)+)